MVSLLVREGPLNLPSPRRRTGGSRIDTAAKFFGVACWIWLHAAGVEVAAVGALVVRLHRLHLDPDAAGGADGALAVGVDGAGGGRVLDLPAGGGGRAWTLRLGHGRSIPEPSVAETG